MANIQSLFENIRRILISVVEKYHPFNFKYFKVLVFVIMTLLLGAVFILGWRSSQQVKETVTEDFNQQQLVLARHVADQIENSLDSLKREIQLLSLSPAIQYSELPALKNRMENTFSSIKHQGTLEIRFIENKHQRVYHVSENHSCISEKPPADDMSFLEWAMKDDQKGKILLTSVALESFGDQLPKPHMKIMIPVWQVSVDDSHPVATNKFSGVLIFVVDASHLIKGITREIRSGKTGYAWIIDENGMFLYHQEKTFIGQNAFEARKGKMSTISFARINEIQKEKMLKGEEGTSWYISGWHRGIEGEIKKLIAYTPIHLGQENNIRIWSVAVVAPITEVEGAIHSIHFQQFILQGLIIFLILFGGLFINFMIL
ncbi:MAG: cache domain-containing protein, partial [Thermodesulfovibrionales bacterium]|nr:cache domain-containing protein [Thermodesulfovibrionales bacterium]